MKHGLKMNMRRLYLFIMLLGFVCPLFPQAEENIFEWGGKDSIVVKDKFLGLYRGKYTDYPTHVYKEYDVSTNGDNSYVLKLKGFDEVMSDLGTYEGFEIYCNGKMLLDCLSCDPLKNVGSITLDKDKSHFMKVPLSDDSFALFFGGLPYDDGDAPELIIVVVSGGVAKVVYDNRALAYKYVPAPNFSIEFVEKTGYIYTTYPLDFSESFLKSRTKYKIWKEGNMLKYKSWK